MAQETWTLAKTAFGAVQTVFSSPCTVVVPYVAEAARQKYS